MRPELRLFFNTSQWGRFDNHNGIHIVMGAVPVADQSNAGTWVRDRTYSATTSFPIVVVKKRMRQELKKALSEVLRCAKERKPVEDTYALLAQEGHSVATINTAVDLLRDEDYIAEFLIEQTNKDEIRLDWRLTWEGAEMMDILESEDKKIGFKVKK